MSALASFNLVVTKDKVPGLDNAQVPAAANADFYRQGATVKTGVTVANGATNVTIVVRNPGRIVAGDTLQRNVTAPPTVTVVSVGVGATTITVVVNSNNNGAMALAAGDRLVVTTNRPAVYKESTGVDAYGASQVATDAMTGVLAPAYVREPFYDVVISGTGVATRLLSDVSGGFLLFG